jgi:hypothetical protein
MKPLQGSAGIWLLSFAMAAGMAADVEPNGLLSSVFRGIPGRRGISGHLAALVDCVPTLAVPPKLGKATRPIVRSSARFNADQTGDVFAVINKLMMPLGLVPLPAQQRYGELALRCGMACGCLVIPGNIKAGPYEQHLGL